MPTNAAVASRRVCLVSRCELCASSVELDSHLFLDCPFSLRLWQRFTDILIVHWPSPVSIDDFFLWGKRKARVVPIKDAWTVGMIIMMYCIWLECNHRRFDGIALEVDKVFSGFLTSMKKLSWSFTTPVSSIIDLCCARRLDIPIIPNPTRVMLEVRWHCPSPGWVKLNVDGCSLGNPGRTGAGGVLRDHRATHISAFSVFLSNLTNYEVEFRAIFIGLLRAKDLGITHLWVECDSKAVVDALNAKSIPLFVTQQWMGLQPFLDSIS
ncbi:uncharacterized protein LOC122650734 [Telopea speciosissima]|uniref:uncharacterized protein LOC122650734 n=1 Tax=Telopea speciosissima TaxID=54955 RepID=UPI001CC34E38|nr:uncharacterized protein LOC122650734 [Telopea speciosissima]